MPAQLWDVSVLIALFDTSHVHNKVVSQWVIEHENDRWASCAITENGFIRVGSRQGYPNFQPTPEFVAAGLRALKQKTAERHEYWPCDVSLADTALFDLSVLNTGRHSTDVFLAGLAHRHGGRFVTLDAKVSWQAVRGAGPELIERITA